MWPVASLHEVKEATVSLQDNLLATGYGCLTEETGPVAKEFRLADKRAKFGLWPSPPAWWTSP